jgi:hypothetical protein
MSQLGHNASSGLSRSSYKNLLSVLTLSIGAIETGEDTDNIREFRDKRQAPPDHLPKIG